MFQTSLTVPTNFVITNQHDTGWETQMAVRSIKSLATGSVLGAMFDYLTARMAAPLTVPRIHPQ